MPPAKAQAAAISHTPPSPSNARSRNPGTAQQTAATQAAEADARIARRAGVNDAKPNMATRNLQSAGPREKAPIVAGISHAAAVTRPERAPNRSDGASLPASRSTSAECRHPSGRSTELSAIARD